MYPSEYRYTKDHEWVKVEGDFAMIGITDHAQHQLGDIVFVELPEDGSTFSAGDEFGTVESVKAVAEVYMPITGEVTEINEDLEERPELVNERPHDDGWLIRVRITDPSELDELMDAEAYESFVEEESK
ncbi:MAG: glycine cleavage system protein GcvH [Acidobacteria bacterium]|nr:glycine cleavage system protein GcvH [Acidobacteriota bacterium]